MKSIRFAPPVQQWIDALAAFGLFMSLLIFVAHNPSWIMISYRDTGAWAIYAGITFMWFLVPGALLAVMSSVLVLRLLGWLIWAYVVYVCYRTYPSVYGG